MTCSKNLGRLLQASCLGLIGMLTVVGCGGSESTKTPDAAVADGGSGGSTGAALNATPSSVTFGSVDLGKSGTATTTITNTGKAASGTLSVVPGAGLTAAGCTGTLAAGASCTLTITATPTTLGVFSSTVTVSANPGTTTPLQISVSGTATAPGQFSVSPGTIDLGNLLVGAVAPKQTITVTAQVALTDLAVNLNGADVTKDATSTCVAALAASTSCIVVVNFTATSAGPKSDSLVVSAGGANGKVVTVPITAIAQAPAKLVISPSTTQAFATTVNVPSSAIVFGLANSGDVATGALGVAVTGANAADFKATSTGCTILAPLANCTISVVFTPTVVGAAAEAATLVVTDSGSATDTVSVPLTGTAIPASSLAITPATSDLGTVLVGVTGTATSFTVTNNGDTASGALSATLSSAEFVVVTDACNGVSLAKAGTCTISIALKPATVGAKSAILTVQGTSGAPAVRNLTGTGISGASLSASPLSLDFGSVRVNTAGTAQTVTITNNGGVATGALTLTKGGSFGMFPVSGNTCTAALAPAAKCTITIGFAPTGDPASLTATFSVTDGTSSVTISAAGNALGAAALTIVSANGLPCVVSSPRPTNTPGVANANVATCGVLNDTIVGGTSNTATLTVSMGTLPAGATDSGALTPVLAGTNKGDFTIVQNNCTTPLLANASCTITVALAPIEAGTLQAALTVTSTNGGTATASLQAMGLPVLQIVQGTAPVANTTPDGFPLLLDTAGAPTTNGTLAKLSLDFGQVPLNGPVTNDVKYFGVIVRGPLKPAGSTAADPVTTTNVVLSNATTPADFNYTAGTLSNPCTAAALDVSAILAAAAPTQAPLASPLANWFVLPSEFGVYCQFPVVFYPQTSKGAKTASITATGTGGGSDTAALTGEATGPLTITPSMNGFANQETVGDSTNNDYTSPLASISTNVSIAVNPNLTLTIKNTSTTTAIGPITVALSGTNAGEFIIVDDQCTNAAALVAATGVCTVTIAFAPTSAGAKTATFTASGSGEVATYTINGNAGTLLPLTLTPSGTDTAKIDFGVVTETTVGQWMAFTVSNPNPVGTALTPQLSFGMDDGTYFEATGTTVQPTGGCGTATGTTGLAGGQQCLIWVRFKPTTALTVGTPVFDTLLVNGVNPGLASQVSGTPASQLSISQGTTSSQLGLAGVTAKTLTYDFGSLAQTAKGTNVTFTVSNLSAAAAPLVLSNALIAPFTVDQTSQCTTTRSTLQPAGDAAGLDKCSLVVFFTGVAGQITTPEAESATLQISVGGGADASDTAKATLTGTTIKPAQLIAVGLGGATTIDLGTITKSATPVTSSPVVLTIQNTGDVAATSLHFTWAGGTVDGATFDPFQVLPETTGSSCLGLSSLAKGATCKLTIQAAPSATLIAGVKTNNFTLSADGGLSVSNITVQATVQPAASVFFDYNYPTGSALQYGFFSFTRDGAGKVAQNGNSDALIFQLNNSSGTGINPAGLALTGANAADFTLALNAGSAPCSAAGTTMTTSCTFSVTFHPTVAWSSTTVYRFASVSITVGNVAETLGFEGQVQAPAILQLTSPHPDGNLNNTNFGEVSISATPTQTFTLTNIGETASAAITLSTTGTNAALFEATGCTGTLAPAGICTITVTLQPTAVGNALGATLHASDGVVAEVTEPLLATIVNNLTLRVLNGAASISTYTFATAQEVGSTSSPVALTVDNPANSHSTGALSVLSITGADAASFVLVTTGCADAIKNGLATGETSCPITVAFAPARLPASPSTLTATLTVSDGTANSKSVTLIGTAKSALTISPTPVALGTAVKTQLVTVTLASDVEGPTAMLQTSLTGTDAASFFIQDNACAASQLSNLRSGGADTSCTINVVYIGGSTLTAKSATLTVTDGSTGGGNTISAPVTFTP